MHGTRYANEAIDNADLLISAGARFDDRVTGDISKFAKRAKVVHFDIDPAEHSKVIHAHIPVVGNLKETLGALLQKLDSVQIDAHDTWIQQVNGWKKQYPLRYEASDSVIKPQYLVEQVSELTQGKAIIASGVGQHQMWAAQYYCFQHPRQWVTSGGLGTMGFGLPSSLGAQIGQPDIRTVCITGDGSVQMNIQELATASFYNVPVIICVLDNGYLGMVRQWQEIFFDRRYSSTHLEHGNPDFVTVAKGFGVEAFKITRPDEVRPALEKALAISGPVLIHCMVEQEENVYPMIPSGKTVHDTIG